MSRTCRKRTFREQSLQRAQSDSRFVSSLKISCVQTCNSLNFVSITECNADGTYKAKQCHPPSVNGKRFCQCWAPDGTILTAPTQEEVNCDAHVNMLHGPTCSCPECHG